MRAVNLLPSDYTDARRVPLSGRLGPLGNPVRVVPVVAALVLVAILAVGYVTQSRTVDDRQETLDVLQAELAARPKPVAVAAPTSDAGIRLAAATAASASRVAWEEVMHQLSLVLPADISLTSLTAGGPAAAVPTGTDTASAAPALVPSGFTVAGYTVSHPAVARLLVQLDKAPTLGNVQLQNSIRTDRNGRPVIDFTIGASIVPEGAGS